MSNFIMNAQTQVRTFYTLERSLSIVDFFNDDPKLQVKQIRKTMWIFNV